MLSIPKIREEANKKNGRGFTALDILHQTPKDFKSFEIQLMLMDIDNVQSTIHPSPPPSVPHRRPSHQNYLINRARNLLRSIFPFEGNWVAERRETLILVTTVITTMSFQAAISPSGGVFQDVNTNDKDTISPTQYKRDDGFYSVVRPGDALLGIRNPD